MTPEPTRVEPSESIPGKPGGNSPLRPITWFLIALPLLFAWPAVLFLRFVASQNGYSPRPGSDDPLSASMIVAGNVLCVVGLAVASVQLLGRTMTGRPQFSLRSLLVAGAVFAGFCSVGATCGWPAIGGLTAAALQLLAPVIVVLSSRRRPRILQAAFTGAIVAVVASFGVSAFCGATIGVPQFMVGWRGPSLRAAFYGPIHVSFIAGLFVWPYCVIVAVGALEGVVCSKVHGRLRETMRRPKTWFVVASALALVGFVAIPLLKNTVFESWAYSYGCSRLFDLLAAGMVAAGIASGAVGFVIRHRLRKI